MTPAHAIKIATPFFLRLLAIGSILVLFFLLLGLLSKSFAAEPVNDPKFPDQWNLKRINAPAAWEVASQNSGSVIVAVIDSGIDYTHEDLLPNLWHNPKETLNKKDDDHNGFKDDYYGINLAYNTGDPWDDYGHGTTVAGVLAATTNNGLGIAGMGYNIKIMAIKVTDNQGAIPTIRDYKRVQQAIHYAVDNGAKVINVSLAFDSFDKYFTEGVDYALSKNVLIVGAAGNTLGGTGVVSIVYPAYYSTIRPNVISVVGSDKLDLKFQQSNYHKEYDVAAPAVDIWTTKHSFINSFCGTIDGKYCLTGLNSYTAPQVAGLAALLFAQNPNRTAAEVKNLITQSADPVLGTGQYWKYGRINACKAVGRTDCPSPVQIKIYAAGTSAFSIYPEMELLLDDQFVTKFPYITGDPTIRPYQEYTYTYYAPDKITDISKIKVRFPNATNDPVTGARRELYVDKINVDGVDYESEAADTYTTGHWDGANCKGGWFASEVLGCNGYFQFKKPMPSAFNIVGTYSMTAYCASNCYGGPWSHVMNITSQDPITGEYSGNGYYIPDQGYAWNVSGVVTGNHMTLHIVGYNKYAGYLSDGEATIDLDGTMTGTAVDSLNRSMTWTATKN